MTGSGSPRPKTSRSSRSRPISRVGGGAHGVQPLQPPAQPRRHLVGGGLAIGAFFLRQHQARFQIGQPRRHHQIIGGQLQIDALGRFDELQILVGQLEDRDLGDIDLLVARQGEQQVERPFKAVHRAPPAPRRRRKTAVDFEIVEILRRLRSCRRSQQLGQPRLGGRGIEAGIRHAPDATAPARCA